MKQFVKCSQYRNKSISFYEKRVFGAILSKSYCLSQCSRMSIWICLLCKSAHTAQNKKCKYLEKKIEQRQLAKSKSL